MKQKNNFLGKLKRYRVLLLMLLPAVLYTVCNPIQLYSNGRDHSGI